MEVHSHGRPAVPQRRVLFWAKRLGAIATFAIALVGAITGWISFHRSNNIHVEITPRQASFDARSFDVGLINSSQRAVTLREGIVRFDGGMLGRVTRFVPGPGAGDPRSAEERVAGALQVPFALAAGQALAGTLEWALPAEGYGPEMLRKFERYLSADRRGGQPADKRFTLEVDIEPGDDVSSPILLTVTGFDKATQDGHLRGWHSLLSLEKRSRAVNALVVFAGETTAAIASFELWGSRAKPLLTGRRPVGQSVRFARFAVPKDLAPGSYSWAVSINGAPTAIGRFKTPCSVPARSTSQRHLPGADVPPGTFVASEACVARTP